MASQQRKKTQHDEETVEKAFVNDDGKATLVCPNCNSVKVVTTDQYRERQHRLKVRCSCTHVFVVNLDFRQCFRKETNLTGIFNMHPPAVGGGMVQIQNLSLIGVAFAIKGVHSIEPGHKGRIDFTLDNRRKTRLVREFIVRATRGNSIGCEFRKDQAFEKELGFYLRFGP
ncbi:hypothetical protein [Desulfosediminicola flagellatus]|uniref:hypothetical protein n=1 Tax=Desulfosediminicola flagellatus TaxID=2569541 RepID=UPI0010AD36EE|nr:hypothetical protein [Desulfosediminicola flagellatus]